MHMVVGIGRGGLRGWGGTYVYVDSIGDERRTDGVE